MNVVEMLRIPESVIMYASPVTVRMARMTIAAVTRVETPVRRKSKRVCTCGGLLNHVPKVRNGVKVCDACALKTPRKHGGQKAKTKCTKCKSVGSAASMQMVNKKWYCKTCAPTIKKKVYKRNI